MDDDREKTLDVARGDVGMSRHLEKSLSVLASAGGSAQVRPLIDEVLAGRASARDLLRHAEFSEVLDRFVPDGMSELMGMSDEEREQMSSAARAEMDELAVEKTAHPQAEDTVPGDDDDDDGYWDDRGGILSTSW